MKFIRREQPYWSVRGAIGLTGLVLALAIQGASGAAQSPTEFTSPGYVVLDVIAPEPELHVSLMVRYDGPSMGFIAGLQNRTADAPGIIRAPGFLHGVEYDDRTTAARFVNDRPVRLGWGSGITLPPGPNQVIFLAAGRVTSWNYSVPEGVEWSVRDHGAAYAFSGMGADEGTWAAAHAWPASAHVANGLALDVPITNHLFGVFADDEATVGASVTGPGVQKTCPCYFPIRGETLPGPGSYRFAWTGTGVTSLQVPIAAWADVDLG